MRAVGRKRFECACPCYDAPFGLLGQPSVEEKWVLRCDDGFLCLLQLKTGIEGDENQSDNMRVQSISSSVIAVSAIGPAGPMIGHEGALAPRQSETRVLMDGVGLPKMPTFSRPLPEISLITSGDVKAR